MRKTALLAAAAALFLAACGGGGGSTAPSPYTGLTTPVSIDGNNGDNVALAAYQGADIGVTAAGASPLSVGAAAPAGVRPFALSLTRTLERVALEGLTRELSGRGAAARTIVTVDNTISQPGGGSAHYTVSIDDATGAFQGTFTFANDYLGDGANTINGTMTVSGAIDLQSFTVSGLTLGFGALTVTDGATATTVSGTIVLSIAGDVSTATLNLFVTDEIADRTAWLQDYVITSTAGVGYEDVEMDGRIYLQEYGYVDVATVVPFRYADDAEYPSQGSMVLAGALGRSIRFTAVDEATFRVEIDADADSVYETTITHTHGGFR